MKILQIFKNDLIWSLIIASWLLIWSVPVFAADKNNAGAAVQKVAPEVSANLDQTLDSQATQEEQNVDSAEEKTDDGAGNKPDSVAETKENPSDSKSGDVIKDPPEDEKDGENKFYSDYIHDKLQIGTRTVHHELTDPDSGHKGGTYGTGTYLGTIFALDENQNYAPTRLFLAYNFNKYIGVEVAYDSMEADTVATNGVDTETEKTDGSVSLAGPTLSLIARIPTKTSITPFMGLGIGLFSGDFDEDPDWASTPSWNRVRVMEVEDVKALILTTGASWDFYKSWFVDCSLQYIKADPDATFYGYTDGVLDTEQSGHFPMDNYAFRIGVGYTF